MCEIISKIISKIRIKFKRKDHMNTQLAYNKLSESIHTVEIIALRLDLDEIRSRTREIEGLLFKLIDNFYYSTGDVIGR